MQVQWTATRSGPVSVSVKSSGTAPESVSYAISILPDLAPKRPTNVRFRADGLAIRLSWEAVEGADYYNVYYSDSSRLSCRVARDGTPSFCDELATNVAETTYLHTDPSGDENYWVAACNSEGCTVVVSHSPAVPSSSGPDGGGADGN